MQSAIMGNDVYGALWVGGLTNSMTLGGWSPNQGGGCYNIIELTAATGGGYEGLCDTSFAKIRSQ